MYSLTTYNLKYILTLLLVFVVFTIPFIVFGQSGQEYVLISPIPGSATVDTNNVESTKGFFQNMFNVFVSIISILAVIKLMLCGFQYMTSEAISSKGEAKKCIWTVIGGLFLILLSWLILQTINKDFNEAKFFDRLKQTKESIIN